MFKKSSKLKLALSLAIATATLSANAQVHLNAHDKSIRYDLIPPSHTLYKVAFFDSTGNVTREGVIDHVTKIDTVNKEIAFINSVPFAAGRMLVDSSIDNYSGSARYILATFPSTKYELIKYLPTSVVAHNIIKGVNADKTTPMPGGYFDDNSIWDILGYIPFKKGVKYQLDCYGTDTHTQNLIPYEIEYVFDEQTQAPGGPWVNNMVLKVSYSGTVEYVWIDKKTHETTKTVGQGKGFSFVKVRV